MEAVGREELLREIEENDPDELEQEFADGDERFEEAEGLFEKEDLPDPEDMAEGNFTEVPQYASDMVDEMRDTYHQHLSKAKIAVFFREARWKSKGRTVYAKATAFTPSMRILTGYDFQILINREEFESASEHKKKAIIDSALCQCNYKPNQTTGESTWKTETPDLEGYIENISRFGFWTDELKNAKHAFDQQDMFNEKVAAAEPEEQEESA
jgi:hypothetical protein